MMVWTHSTSLIGLAMGHNEVSTNINGNGVDRMMKNTTIGLDIAKNVFHLVQMNRNGKVISRKMLKRKKVASFFASHVECMVVMETCSGLHNFCLNLRPWHYETSFI